MLYRSHRSRLTRWPLLWIRATLSLPKVCHLKLALTIVVYSGTFEKMRMGRGTTLSIFSRYRRNFCLRAGFALISIGILQLDAAGTYTWVGGAGSNNWSGQTANWAASPGGVPTTNSDVVIPTQFAGVRTSSNFNSTGQYDSLSLNNACSGSCSGTHSLVQLTIAASQTLTLSSASSATSTFGSSASFTGVKISGTLDLEENLSNSTTINALTGGLLKIGASTANVQLTGGNLAGAITNNGSISNVVFGITGTGATVTGGSIGGTLSGTSTTAAVTDTFTGTLNNTGTLTAASGGTISWSGTTNSGILNAGSGTLNITSALTNSGTVNGANYSGNFTVSGGGIIGGTSTLGSTVTLSGMNYADGATVSGGKISTSGTLAGSATFNGVANSTTLTANGGGHTLAFSGGANSGILDTTNGGALLVSGSVNNSAGTITGATYSGGTSISGGALDGASTLGGLLTIDGGTVNLSGSLNGGALEEDSGSIAVTGALDVTTANLIGGTLDGTGSLTAGELNNGTASNNGIDFDVNGSAAAWGGTATIGDANVGTYDQTAGGEIDFNFASDWTANDELLATGGVSLDGALGLLNADGTALDVSDLTGTEYVLIDLAGSQVTGQFSNVSAIEATGIAGIADGAPGAAAGWWLVYNGANAGLGNGDVELDDVAAAPEPGTDLMLSLAGIGMCLLRWKQLVSSRRN